MEHFRVDFEELLRSPIDSATPVGEALRSEGPGQDIYRTLRDLRSQAREQERRQEAAEDALQLRITLSPEWHKVRDLAVELLSRYSKDIEVLVWLIEAETRIDGYAGLERTMRLASGLVRDFGDQLHPQPEEPDDDRFAAIAGLNGVGRDGTLIQPLRLLPLVPGFGYGQHTLWNVESGTSAEAVRSAMQTAGPDSMRAQFDTVAAALAAVRDCDEALTRIAGTDAPPFTQIVEILESSLRAIRQLAGLGEAVEAEEPTANPAAPQSPGMSGVVSSREAAFDQLQQIAVFFRRTEPHSPIADSLETLVRRGRLGFVALLEELIPDESARQAAMKTAGIQLPSGDSGANG